MNLAPDEIMRLGRGHPNDVAYSPDGKTLAVASSLGVWVYKDLTTLDNGFLFPQTSIVTSLSWSPDGTQLATASADQMVRIWAVATRQLQYTLEGHMDAVKDVSWSPDGNLIASSGAENDQSVRLWNPTTGQLIRTLNIPGEEVSVSSVSWSPDSQKIVSGDWSGQVIIWTVANGNLEHTLSGNQGGVRSVAWSHDGSQVAAANHGGTVRVWTTNDNEVPTFRYTLEGHTASITTVQWSPNSEYLVTGSDDKTVRIWNAVDGTTLRRLSHDNGVSSVDWSPDGTMLASLSYDSQLRLWDVSAINTTEPQVSTSLLGYDYLLYDIDWSPDDSFFVTSNQFGLLRLWNASDGSLVRTISGHTSRVQSVQFSPDGTKLASGSYDNTVRLWSIDGAQLLPPLSGHEKEITTVSWSPDGQYVASGSADKTIRVWIAATGELSQTLMGHTDTVIVSWSPDGQQIASASGDLDRTIKIWDVASGASRDLVGHTGYVTSVAWSSDGSRLASASGDTSVRIWDTSSGAVLQTLTGHTRVVWDVQWSPDNSRLASASADKTVRLWSRADGQMERVLDGHTDSVVSVTWPSTGERVASISSDGTIRLWRVNEFSCSDVSEIPQSECQAVVALYNNTDGSNWHQNVGWLRTNTPCSWFGIECSNGHVSRLILPNNQLTGSLSSELSGLTQLKVIQLYQNDLQGEIPPELGQLSLLENIQLQSNQLSGPLPVELGNLQNLGHLSLHINRLTGLIPTELSNAKNLTVLQLSNNLFTGTIPSELGTLSNLTALGIAGTQIDGEIPKEFGNLSKLTNLALHDNQLSGSIPQELGQLTNLVAITLNDNALTGAIPSSIGNLVNLRTLHLHKNQLSGEIPVELNNLAKVEEFSLQDNQLSGTIPPFDNLLNVLRLNLHNNQLSGSIPPDLASLPKIEQLLLYGNLLTGTIPRELGNLDTLIVLAISHNLITGSVPPEFGNLTRLMVLWLNNTSLSGCLPQSLVNLTELKDFNFENTELQEPDNKEFQDWLNGIETVKRTGLRCPVNESCSSAKSIPATGEIQSYTFQQPNEEHWVKFDATAGTRYMIKATTPLTSTANVVIGLLDSCNDNSPNEQDNTFSPDVQLEFDAQTSTTYYIKLTNKDPSVAGPSVRYELYVRDLSIPSTANSALILVAGATKNNDVVQPNIYKVTDLVRQTFLNHGYSDDNIYYLTPTDSNRGEDEGVDGEANLTNLEQAITTWAAERVDATGSLTLYLMDHGSRDLLFLDKRTQQWVSPTQIDGWLDQLEAQYPGLKVNIIVEACYAGSFISATETTTDTVSSLNRVVMTSTGDRSLAWASAQGGARFSDRLLFELNRKATLYESFAKAQAEASAYHPSQTAWLDANGNGIPNEPADQSIASQRGFGISGSLPDDWPPSVFSAEASQVETDAMKVLRADVRDDVGVKRVWAVIYSPRYIPPTESEALVRDADAAEGAILTLGLTDADGDGMFSVTSNDFEEPGNYRVVFYAEDTLGQTSSPKTLNVVIDGQGAIFLPLVIQ
ncbi:MAG: hypothetical protein AAF702_22425 [Chloroflexota bacterium]